MNFSAQLSSRLRLEVLFYMGKHREIFRLKPLLAASFYCNCLRFVCADKSIPKLIWRTLFIYLFLIENN